MKDDKGRGSQVKWEVIMLMFRQFAR
jgi:hypothetical protein